MTTPFHSRNLGPARVGLRLVATAALLCLLSGGAFAQDTDDDGVLPVTGPVASSQTATTPPDSTGGSNNSGSGNATNEQVVSESTVLVAGELEDQIDPTKATIEFRSATASAGLITGAPAEVADFVADPPAVSAGDNGAGPMLQGSGRLSVPDSLQARFVAAQLSTKSIALLVLAKDGPSLEAELAGAGKPELVLPLGSPASLDLVKLAALTAKYSQLLPGYHATIVFVSVNAGELHVSAVRSHTGGGPLDVLVH